MIGIVSSKYENVSQKHDRYHAYTIVAFLPSSITVQNCFFNAKKAGLGRSFVSICSKTLGDKLSESPEEGSSY